jgi:hypothetical protein
MHDITDLQMLPADADEAQVVPPPTGKNCPETDRR